MYEKDEEREEEEHRSSHYGFLANLIINGGKDKEMVKRAMKEEREITEKIVKGYFQMPDNTIHGNALDHMQWYMTFFEWVLTIHKDQLDDAYITPRMKNALIESELFQLQNHGKGWKEFWKWMLKRVVG